MTTEQSSPLPQSPESRFFQKVDWTSFGLTTLLVLAVYWLTLAPAVTLEYSGVYATGALHSSPSMPSGHPVWAVYGWLFTKSIPFSNIACRLSLASATAGALACGLVALVVSRVGFLLAEELPAFKSFSSREQYASRLVCGVVAGLGLGFDRGFWGKAVVADVWPLGLLLFALTLCFLSQWFFAPQRKRYLFLAALFHGLTLSESQAFIPATFAFPALLAFGDRKLGQQIFLTVTVCLVGIILQQDLLDSLGWSISPTTRHILIAAAFIAALSWGGLWFSTRRFFRGWKAASGCAALFLAGLGFCFLLPIFSMTNPPINWGYPRTVEGFFHVLSRGQFASVDPTGNFRQLLMQWQIYGKIALVDLGPLYLLAAALPFLLLHKVPPRPLRWLVGLLAVWFLITLLTLAGLNVDSSGAQQIRPFFAPTHLILVLFAGFGLILLAGLLGNPHSAAIRRSTMGGAQPETDQDT
ncbi:MAG TPA: DUF2723 domain-containing protein [Clostridia bacterium]|nr:DUF2723 domain-containing protein [Clostridia bacterium]